jgi:hypothetical protein
MLLNYQISIKNNQLDLESRRCYWPTKTLDLEVQILTIEVVLQNMIMAVRKSSLMSLVILIIVTAK